MKRSGNLVPVFGEVKEHTVPSKHILQTGVQYDAHAFFCVLAYFLSDLGFELG